MTPQRIMAPSDHGELASVLTGLYTLLDTLAAIPDNANILLPSDSGIYPADISDTNAARQAGFSDEAVHALSIVPYLEDGTLGPRTFPQSYSGPDADPKELRRLRQMFYDEENLTPPSAMQLTFSEGGHGVVYVYDSDQSTNPHGTAFSERLFANNRSRSNLILQPTLATISMYRQNPLAKLCNRQLTVSAASAGWTCLCMKSRTMSWSKMYSTEAKNLQTLAMMSSGKLNDHERRLWEAQRGLKDVYLECGWDVEAEEQTTFRRDEFLRGGRIISRILSHLWMNGQGTACRFVSILWQATHHPS